MLIFVILFRCKRKIVRFAAWDFLWDFWDPKWWEFHQSWWWLLLMLTQRIWFLFGLLSKQIKRYVWWWIIIFLAGRHWGWAWVCSMRFYEYSCLLMSVTEHMCWLFTGPLWILSLHGIALVTFRYIFHVHMGFQKHSWVEHASHQWIRTSEDSLKRKHNLESKNQAAGGSKAY